MEPRRLTIRISSAQAGKTVDCLLRRELLLSGTAVKRAKCAPGGLLLDGLPVRTDARADEGQLLSVLVGDTDGGDLVPVPGPLDILYEDEDLLLVNKAPGVATHPGPGHYDDTLGNYLAEYYREKGILAAYHPVNRLDRSTSGVMAVAKHAHAQQRLIPQLHTGAFARSYLALCRGAPQPARGVVDASIGRAEGSALRREVRPDGAPACTGYQVLETFGDRALLRLEPETGRTHQIRVHMAYLGCPLLGDFLYGVEEPALIARAALHAHRLRLVHPLSGAALEAEAPLPADMSALLPPDVRKKFCF